MTAPALLSINPEFQRNVWLELTPTRLIAAPLILLIVVGGLNGIGSPDTAARLARLALWFLLTLWGARLAAESFADEVTRRTWDAQRLSAEMPLRLTLGKLFGGTAFVWYAAAWCGAALLLLKAPGAQLDLADAALGGLTAQSTALFVVLLLHRFDGDARRSHVALAQALGVVAAWKSGLLALPLELPAAFLSGPVRWYGLDFPARDFLLALQIASVFWLIFGSVRIVRRELGFMDGPLGWTLYTAYALILTAGLTPFDTFALPRMSLEPFRFGLRLGLFRIETLTGIAAMALTYLALLFTPVSRNGLRRFGAAFAARDWRGLWQDLPPWSLSLATFGALALSTRGEALVPLAMVGFVVRDIALVTLLRLTWRRQSVVAILVMFAMLYAVLPFLLGHLSFGLAPPLFYPGFQPGIAGLIAPWAEALIAGLAVRLALRSPTAA